MLIAMLLAAAASAPRVSFTTAAEVEAAIARAKPSGPASSAATLGERPGYRILAIRRTAAGSAELHEKDSDIWYVLEGAGTLVTEGTLVGGQRTGKGEVRGTSIRGGTARRVGKGDVVTIDPRTPHWLSAVEGSIQYLTIKVPRP